MTAIANTPQAWSERAEKHETSWEAAGWSEHGQTQRFLAVCKHLDVHGRELVLDFGCGTGRLVEFLPAKVNYHGYDTSEAMRERAAREHPRAVILDRLYSKNGDPYRFAHVVCIGPFNLADEWSREATFETIVRLWETHTVKSLSVSLYRGTDPATLAYGEDWALSLARALSPRFVLDCDYLDNDMLLKVTK